MGQLHLHITGGGGPDYFLGEQLVVATTAYDQAVATLIATGIDHGSARRLAAEESFWSTGREGVSRLPPDTRHCRTCDEALPYGGQFCTDACSWLWEELQEHTPGRMDSPTPER
jgi:hypothetical protein